MLLANGFVLSVNVLLSATLILAKGVHPKIVQELPRHSNISMTMNVYLHVL